MAIQLVRDQLVNSIINADKLNDGAVSFAKLLSTDILTDISGTVSDTKLATSAAIKTYVDAQVPDTFQGGDGINIDASGDPDVISVDLATNPGLQFTSNKLDLKLKSESGGSLTKDGNGLYIADSAISNAKLANSTISGIALGANLNSLSAGNGLSMTAYNGSAAVSDLTIDLDGSTLAVGSDGLKVAANGIGSNEIADGAVSDTKVNFAPMQDILSPGSATAYALTDEVPAGWEAAVQVFRNGVMLRLVIGSEPSGLDQYKVTTNAGTTSVTFGAAPDTNSDYEVRYWAIVP
jgi:hypothetical protein